MRFWSFDHIMIAVLTVVDLCALGVGLTILRKVTNQIKTTGTVIEDAVKDGINTAKSDAIQKFTDAVGPALGHIATIVPGIISDAIGEKIRVTVGASAEVKQGEHEISIVRETGT